MLDCAVCYLKLNKCTCLDIDERLAALRNDKYVIYAMCRKCSKHYMRCACPDPDWTVSHDNKELSDFGIDKKDVIRP